MAERMTCAACGHVGYDVSTRLVENPNPDGLMKVQGANSVYQVPARWISQLRCMDKVACRDRTELRFSDEGTLLEGGPR